MTWWTRWLRRGRLERQLDAELRDHVERQIAADVASGLTEAEARRRAALLFGGVEQTKEACRDARGTRWLDELSQDVRHGARVLRQAPAFTLVAVLSLALGIGANTAIFSLVNSLLLKTLPVHEPERLAWIDREWTNPIWEQIRERRAQLFENAAAWSPARFDLARGGEKQPVQGLWVSGDFFDVLGVPALLGRTLTVADDRRGGGPDGATAVISHAFWQRHYAGRADAISRTLMLDDVPFTIVGVTPAGFLGPAVGPSFDVAVPLGTEPLLMGADSGLDERQRWWLIVFARLKPGQSLDQATAALRGVQPQIRDATRPASTRASAGDSYLRDGLTLMPAGHGPSGARERFARPLLALMVVVIFVLLIACANIANLLLARASRRQHEVGVRLALGASRLRIARQLLTESLLLAALGAALGLALGRTGLRVLMQHVSSLDSRVELSLSLDWRMLAFTAGVAIATALIFGLAPALRAGRIAPTEALKDQGRTLTGEGRHAISQPLVVLQVALSLTLVVAAGLFVRTFSSLATLDLGLDRDPVLVVDVDAQRSIATATTADNGNAQDIAAPAGAPATSASPAARDAMRRDAAAALFARIRDAAAAMPGVDRAAISMLTPVGGGGWNGRFAFPDRPALTPRERMSFLNAIGPGWFATYGTTLRAGRDFTPDDRAGTPPVAIVNEAFAHRFMNGANPVGRAVLREGRRGQPPASLTVVGLVEDAAYGSSLRRAVPPVVYLPIAQTAADVPPASIALSVRAAEGVDPVRLTKSVAAAIAEVDPGVSLTFRPLAAQIRAALSQERLLAMLSGFFAALALLLAGIGLYGVTAFAVSRRRAEIGIRMALGADARGVVRLVLGRLALLVCLGLALGLTFSLWASRFVTTLLYGVPAGDPLTIVSAILVLVIVAGGAGWLPARGAARVDPARVLREG